ncbi:MAG: hypothetical protein PF961_21830 [Planctomycetota bacterium]|nr:hypothetical protein [Planctomycetota bacterium]
MRTVLFISIDENVENGLRPTAGLASAVGDWNWSRKRHDARR